MGCLAGRGFLGGGAGGDGVVVGLKVVDGVECTIFIYNVDI